MSHQHMIAEAGAAPHHVDAWKIKIDQVKDLLLVGQRRDVRVCHAWERRSVWLGVTR